MLQDPRSRRLGENFGCQWLGITTLGTTVRPDSKQFPTFDDDLAATMRDEAVLLVNSVVREDHSLLDLLDADYTFLNGRLARHYGIDGVQGREMRKVQLPDRNRGGVLGLGAVLTCTSYPLRTSPVLRGKWVLEQLLGRASPAAAAGRAGKLPQDDRKRGRADLPPAAGAASHAGGVCRLPPEDGSARVWPGELRPVGRWRLRRRAATRSMPAASCRPARSSPARPSCARCCSSARMQFLRQLLPQDARLCPWPRAQPVRPVRRRGLL